MSPASGTNHIHVFLAFLLSMFWGVRLRLLGCCHRFHHFRNQRLYARLHSFESRQFFTHINENDGALFFVFLEGGVDGVFLQTPGLAH